MDDLSDRLYELYSTCSRCGRRYNLCVHTGTGRRGIDPEHAERIKVAYAIGRELNPDHDETDYFAQTLNPPAI